MDYTETPYAEDLSYELDNLIEKYLKLGMKNEHVAQILRDATQVEHWYESSYDTVEED